MIILAFVHKGYMSYYTTYLMHTHSVHTSLLLFIVPALARFQCGVLFGPFWSYCLCLEHGPLHSARDLHLKTMQFRLWLLNPCCMNGISRILELMGWIRHDEQAKKTFMSGKVSLICTEFLHMHNVGKPGKDLGQLWVLITTFFEQPVFANHHPLCLSDCDTIVFLFYTIFTFFSTSLQL